MQHPRTTVRQPKNQLKRSILSGCPIKKLPRTRLALRRNGTALMWNQATAVEIQIENK